MHLGSCAQGTRRLAKTVDHLVDRAVPSGSNDGAKAVLDRLLGQAGGAAGGSRLNQRHIPGQSAKPFAKALRLVATGGGVEYQRDGRSAHSCAILLGRLRQSLASGDQKHHCHAHRKTVGNLIENGRSGVIGDLAVDLHAPVDRPGMHHNRIRLKPTEPLRRKSKKRTIFADARKGRKPLTLMLNAEQVNKVRIRESLIDIISHAAAHFFEDARNERRRATKRDVCPQFSQRPDVRPGDAAVQNIPKNGDVEAADVALLFNHRERVEKRLRGMFVGTVTGVDHAAVHHTRQQMRGPLGTVADDDDIRTERLKRLACVAQRLAFAEGRGLGGEVDHVRVEPHRRQFKTDARTGGGLDKKVHHGAAAQRRYFFDGALTDRLEGARSVEDRPNLLGTQRLDIEQMFSGPVHSLGFRGCSETESSPPVSVRET